MSPFPLLTLRILSPDGVSIDQEQLTSISVPLADGGRIGIKPGHAPLIAETARGSIKFRSETGETSIEVHPGVLEIKGQDVIILTAGEVSERAEFIAEPAQIAFNRLMQTLVSKLQPDQKNGAVQDHYG